MKKYTFIKNYTGSAMVEVLAETDEEALAKASEAIIDIKSINFTEDIECDCVSKSYITEDLQSLIEESENILKEYGDLNVFDLDKPVCATIQIWMGYDWETSVREVSAVFWNENANEIRLLPDDCDDIALEEVEEVYQYYICKEIIRTYKLNK